MDRNSRLGCHRNSGFGLCHIFGTATHRHWSPTLLGVGCGRATAHVLLQCLQFIDCMIKVAFFLVIRTSSPSMSSLSALSVCPVAFGVVGGSAPFALPGPAGLFLFCPLAVAPPELAVAPPELAAPKLAFLANFVSSLPGMVARKRMRSVIGMYPKVLSGGTVMSKGEGLAQHLAYQGRDCGCMATTSPQPLPPRSPDLDCQCLGKCSCCGLVC